MWTNYIEREVINFVRRFCRGDGRVTNVKESTQFPRMCCLSLIFNSISGGGSREGGRSLFL